MLNRSGVNKDLSGTPFLRCCNLFSLLLPVVRMKLRLPTSSMIMQTLSLSRSSLTNTALVFFLAELTLNGLHQQGDLIFVLTPVSKSRPLLLE